VARRSFLIPSQLRPPLLLRSQRLRAPQAGRPGSPRPMVPHMAWGRRSRIHLRSMSLARLRQPRCPVMATTHASLPGLAPAPASATTSARDLPSSPTTCSTSCLPSPKPLACALAEQDKAGMNRKVLLLSISFDGGCQSLCLPRCWMLVPSQAHHFGKHVMIYIC
jgi:hypothetical protein